MSATEQEWGNDPEKGVCWLRARLTVSDPRPPAKSEGCWVLLPSPGHEHASPTHRPTTSVESSGGSADRHASPNEAHASPTHHPESSANLSGTGKHISTTGPFQPSNPRPGYRYIYMHNPEAARRWVERYNVSLVEQLAASIKEVAHVQSTLTAFQRKIAGLITDIEYTLPPQETR